VEVATLDQARPATAPPSPGFWWRVLSPVGAVLVAFVVLAVGAGILDATSISDDGAAAILTFGTSVLLLAFGVLLWLRLPAHERRAAVALKHSAWGAVGLGVTMGIGLVIGAGTIILIGTAIDPVVERRIDDIEEIGTVPWMVVLTVIAVVVLAPLGEELLFRGLLLRGLVQRMRFWYAAALSSLLFSAAHADSYLLWPRALSLFLTGLVLAWLYRWRGYWASATAHATVNLVAAVALVASS
jgi:membrane protease YdiL (CAAX protease family)